MRTSTIIHIEDGKLINRTAVAAAFSILHDGKYKMELSSYKIRSLSQNNYYWQMIENYIQPGLYDLGWRDIKSKEAAHDFVRELFLKIKIINEQTGEEMERIKSTTELTTTQFNEYLEEIWQWAAEYLLISIPAPNEQLSFYESEEEK
jgi:hypothetical protein